MHGLVSQGWVLLTERQSSGIGPQQCSGVSGGWLLAKDKPGCLTIFTLAFQMGRYHWQSKFL